MGAFFITLLLCFTFCIFSAKSENACSSSPLDTEKLKFPKRNALMTIEEFDTYIVEKPIRDIAFLKEKGTYVSDSNFFCTITKQDENRYQRRCTGITEQCNLYNAILTNKEGSEKALFTVGTKVEAYWSPCPTRYFLRIQCGTNSNNDDSVDCGVNNLNLNVFLPGTKRPSDAPLNEIVSELNKTTKLKFGDVKGMEWALDFADGTPCEHIENE